MSHGDHAPCLTASLVWTDAGAIGVSEGPGLSARGDHEAVGPSASVQFPLAMAVAFGDPDRGATERPWDRHALSAALFPRYSDADRRAALTRRLSDLRRKYGWQIGADLRCRVVDHFWVEASERNVAEFLRRCPVLPWLGWPEAWLAFAAPSGGAEPSPGGSLVAAVWARWHRDTVGILQGGIATALRDQRLTDAGVLAGALVRVAPDHVATADLVRALPEAVRRVEPLASIITEWADALRGGQRGAPCWPRLTDSDVSAVLARLTSAESGAAGAAVDPRILGREATAEWLWRQLLRAAARYDAGSAAVPALDHVVALMGKLGVGKTSLVDAVLSRLKADPVRRRWSVVRWHAAGGAAAPYAALTQGLVSGTSMSSTVVHSALWGGEAIVGAHNLAVEIAQALELRDVGEVAPASVAAAMVRALQVWLRTVDPAVWILEDLDQWDALSRGIVLRVLAERRADRRVVVVVAGDPSGMWWRRQSRSRSAESQHSEWTEFRLEDVVVEVEEVPPLSAVAVAAWLNDRRPPTHPLLAPEHPLVRAVVEFSRGLPRNLQDVDLHALFAGKPLSDIRRVVVGRVAGLSRIGRMQLGVVCALQTLATPERLARALAAVPFAGAFGGMAELVASELLADAEGPVVALRHPEYIKDVALALGRDFTTARLLAQKCLATERVGASDPPPLAVLARQAELLEEDPAGALGPVIAAWEEVMHGAAQADAPEVFLEALHRATAAASRLGEPPDAVHRRVGEAFLARGQAGWLELHHREWEREARRRNDRVSLAEVALYRVKAGYRCGPQVTRHEVQQAFAFVGDRDLPLTTRLAALEVAVLANEDGWWVRVTPEAIERWRELIAEAPASPAAMRAGTLMESSVGAPVRALSMLTAQTTELMRRPELSVRELFGLVPKILGVLRTVGAIGLADSIALNSIPAADRLRLPGLAANLQLSRIMGQFSSGASYAEIQQGSEGFAGRLTLANSPVLHDLALIQQFAVAAVLGPAGIPETWYEEVVRRRHELGAQFGVRTEFWTVAHLAWAARLRGDAVLLAAVTPRVQALLQDATAYRFGESAVFAAIGALVDGPSAAAAAQFERYAFPQPEWPRRFPATAWQVAAHIAPDRLPLWQKRAEAEWKAAIRAVQPTLEAAQQLWAGLTVRLNQRSVSS